MEAHAGRLKIAVIGGGVAGVASAHLLSTRHDVTLIERNDYVGGHTNTIEVEEDGRTIPVDTGFIVCNPRTYPLFYQLLEAWGVGLRDSDMSFGYSCDASRLAYVGPAFRDVMRRPSTLLDPRILSLFIQQRRFNRSAAADLQTGVLDGCSLGDYARCVGVSDAFMQRYLIPLAGAVWSTPDLDVDRFPAKTFVRFFDNHGMLDMASRPTWQTVVGGSYTYVKAFMASFKGDIITSAPVSRVRRVEGGVEIARGDSVDRYDVVVLATHADESLAMLADATPQERDALTSWTYHRNHMQLHTDASVLPRDRRLWASWNYRRRAEADPAAPVPITYDMNRLQGLDARRDYLVSLNAEAVVDPDAVIYETTYTHPGYTERSIEAQERIRAFNGDRGVYFAGAYLRYGFHEDGVWSAFNVARNLGVDV